MAAGTYSVNLSYGAATAVLNVIVPTEAEQVELTPRPCSEEGDAQINPQQCSFINSTL